MTGTAEGAEAEKAEKPQAKRREYPAQSGPLSDDTRNFMTFFDIQFEDEEV